MSAPLLRSFSSGVLLWLVLAWLALVVGGSGRGVRAAGRDDGRDDDVPCVHGNVDSGTGECVCVQHYTGDTCDRAYRDIVGSVLIPLDVAGALCAGVLVALCVHQLVRSRDRLCSCRFGCCANWTIRGSVLSLLASAMVGRILFFLFCDYYGVFPVGWGVAADELSYNLPIVALVMANLQIILFWIEITGPGGLVSITGLTRMRPVLYTLSAVFALVSLVLAGYAAFSGGYVAHTLLRVYNAWVAVWVLGLAVGLVIWGRRLNAMLWQITAETGVELQALTRVTRMCLLTACIGVSTVVTLAVGSISDFYYRPWMWLLFTGFGRLQELAIALVLLLSLRQPASESGSSINGGTSLLPGGGGRGSGEFGNSSAVGFRPDPLHANLLDSVGDGDSRDGGSSSSRLPPHRRHDRVGSIASYTSSYSYRNAQHMAALLNSQTIHQPNSGATTPTSQTGSGNGMPPPPTIGGGGGGGGSGRQSPAPVVGSGGSVGFGFYPAPLQQAVAAADAFSSVATNGSATAAAATAAMGAPGAGAPVRLMNVADRERERVLSL